MVFYSAQQKADRGGAGAKPNGRMGLLAAVCRTS